MIESIVEKTLPGFGETEAEIEESFLLHYVWTLVEELMFENPMIAHFFDDESEQDLQHKAEILERIYRKEDVSDEELISILELYPKAEDGMVVNVKW